METIQNSQRLDKKVNINGFVDNYGNIQFTNLIFSIGFHFLITFNILLTTILFLEQKEYNLNTYYNIGTQLEIINIRILEWVFFNSLESINLWVGCLENQFNIHIGLNIPSKTINLSNQGYLLIIVTLILSIFRYIFTIYQSIIQSIYIRESSLINVYIPFIFLIRFYKRKQTNRISVKQIRQLKTEKLVTDKEKLELIKLTIFEEENKEKELKIIPKRLGIIYSYYDLYLVDKEEKKTNKKETKTKEDNKKSNYEERLKNPKSRLNRNKNKVK